MNTTSATEPAAPAPGAPPVSYADEPRIVAFLTAHDLDGWVDAAVRLAWDAFPGAKGIELRMFGEPGEYGERLILDVALAVDRAEGRRQYDEFVRRWIDATPPRATDLMGISRTYL